MLMTREEAREWFQIRDRVRDAVLNLETCTRCWRVRDAARLVQLGDAYYCFPGDTSGCMAH